jgi:hypothetical protein
MPRIVCCALLLGLALRAGAIPPSQWLPPEEVVVSEQEMRLEDPQTGHFRSRYWFVNGLLEDGTLLTLSLFQWRYGLVGSAGIFVLVSAPGRELYVQETKLDDLEPIDEGVAYRFGSSLFEGDSAGARIQLRFPDFSCDLEIRNLLNAWKPGDGLLYPSARRDVFALHLVTSPFAELSGDMSVRGEERSVQGWCYADRGLIVMPLQRMNSEQSSFRVFGVPGGLAGEEQEPPWMLSLLESVSARAYGSREDAKLLLAQGDRWLMASGEPEFAAEEYRREQGVPFAFPHRFRVRAEQGGLVVEGEFVVSRLIYLNDIFQKIPPVFRSVVEALIRRPVIYRLAGEFHGWVEDPEGSRRYLDLEGQGEYSVVR